MRRIVHSDHQRVGFPGFHRHPGVQIHPRPRAGGSVSRRHLPRAQAVEEHIVRQVPHRPGERGHLLPVLGHGVLDRPPAQPCELKGGELHGMLRIGHPHQGDFGRLACPLVLGPVVVDCPIIVDRTDPGHFHVSVGPVDEFHGQVFRLLVENFRHDHPALGVPRREREIDGR